MLFSTLLTITGQNSWTSWSWTVEVDF